MKVKDLATEIAKNMKDEAEAIESYNKLLCNIEESNAEEKEELLSLIEEITEDELNHITKLTKIFEALTKLSAKKE